MKINKISSVIALVIVMAFALGGCRTTVKDVNPDTDIRYTAEYGYSDLRKLSAEMANRILQTNMAKEKPAPVMLIFGIENRTDEHIDTKALAYAIRNDLIKSGKFQFINEGVRKKLMKEVWDTDYLGDTRTLDVHIRWLRKKIEDDPSHPVLIRTVRGVGYRFEVEDKKAKKSK